MAKKSILITGASRGIGAACARLFAEEGWAVAVNYNSSEREALALCEDLTQKGCTVLPVKADVSNPEEVRLMVDSVLDNFCQLDTLLCNAGIGQTGLFSDLRYEEWRRLFAVNVDGAYHCIQAALPHFLARKQGSILTISSIWGMVGGSCEVAYSSTKSALIGLCKALAKELGPSNIRVNCIAPGVIETEMNGNLTKEDMEALCEETPLGCVGTPRNVADCALFLASEQGRFFTGQVLSPNGGFVI